MFFISKFLPYGKQTIDDEDIEEVVKTLKSPLITQGPKIEEFDEDYEDPEEMIKRRLEEYKLFKEASEKLKQQENVERFYKEPDKSVGDVRIVYSDFNLEGLVDAFSKLLMRIDDKKKQETVTKEIPKEIYTVKDKVEHIRTVLSQKECISFY